MQFFLDGFHLGDPEEQPACCETQREPLGDGERVDVLIVGSGPAGLVLAAQLARFPSISTRIVERRDGPLQLGQADGVACRTVEMLDTFGLTDRLLRESYWVNETAFWRSDPTDRSRIVRVGRVRDVADDVSEFPHVIVNQARMHRYLLASMRRSAARLTPDYGVVFEQLTIPTEDAAPVRVWLRRDGTSLTVTARYVVGCDGAHSAVRRSIDRELHGDDAHHAWGVMDVLAVTDFPDFRLKCAIQSATAGNILLIPREGGYLVRLYVDLGTITAKNDVRIRSLSSSQVAEIASRVIAPYSLEVKQTAWFSIYEVAQRLTDAFDDTAGRGDGVPRVFIVGDACHTHSAKAGQGMNVSMRDAFNLGWKLAAVMEHRSPSSLLCTYTEERQPVARRLIDFDRKWSAMLGASPSDQQSTDLDNGPPELQTYYVQHARYTMGVATRYQQSVLTGDDTHQYLARGFVVGMRFHSAPVIRVADARRVQLGHVATADGRWRLYAFSDLTQRRLAALCEWLAGDLASPIVRYTPAGADVDSVLDVRAILQCNPRDVTLGRLPALVRPHKGPFGLLDYEKVFTADPACDIFELRGIDRAAGCLVVVRPDQFVSRVFPLAAFGELASCFGPVLLEPVLAPV